MHREKNTIVYIVSVISGWLVFLLLLYFSPFSKFSTVSVFLLYLRKTGREVGGGSGLGTRVHPWQIHVDLWQNQYNIVK